MPVGSNCSRGVVGGKPLEHPISKRRAATHLGGRRPTRITRCKLRSFKDGDSRVRKRQDRRVLVDDGKLVERLSHGRHAADLVEERRFGLECESHVSPGRRPGGRVAQRREEGPAGGRQGPALEP